MVLKKKYKKSPNTLRQRSSSKSEEIRELKAYIELIKQLLAENYVREEEGIGCFYYK